MRISYEIAKGGQEKYLVALAPAGVLNRVSSPQVCTIAAITDNEDGSRTPVGLMMFEMVGRGDRRLTWLYVKKDSRTMGIGNVLLGYFEKFKSYGGMDVLVEEEPAGDFSSEQMSDYLLGRGFKKEGTVNGHIVISRDEIYRSRFVKKAMADAYKLEDIKSFSEVDSEEVIEALGSYSSYAQGKFFFEAADKKVSCIFKKGNDLSGIIAIGYSNGVYSILQLWAKNARVELRVLESAILRLDSVMNVDDILAVDRDSSGVSEWILKLFGKDRIRKQLRFTFQDNLSAS